MAPRRQKIIARSIVFSILKHGDKPKFFRWLSAYFYLYWLRYECVEDSQFTALRKAWNISEEDYRKSFEGKDSLTAMGDMGYSGSTFFSTRNGEYLVKSVPRSFEHTFFRDDLLGPYVEYIKNNPESLLIRITEFLQCSQRSIGTILGLAPSHHIVMENIKRGEGDSVPAEGERWETWDLKPRNYFYPERDVAGGLLASEATKSRLADDFDGKLVLSLDQADAFKGQLEKDTALLAKHNTVDYSLFLVRMPASGSSSSSSSESWRTGVRSADGKYIYRAAILDFFWAKHKVHAKAMTGLIKSYNVVDGQGPMSVTAEPSEYRERFIDMCTAFLDVRGEGTGG